MAPGRSAVDTCVSIIVPMMRVLCERVMRLKDFALCIPVFGGSCIPPALLAVHVRVSFCEGQSILRYCCIALVLRRCAPHLISNLSICAFR